MAGVAALATLGLAACGPTPRQPAPAASPAAAAAAPAAASGDTVRRGYTAADVRFLHHMLMHHAQALAMTALLPSRTSRADMRLLAERIEVSQRDEIAAMRRWLERRGEPVPESEAHREHHAAGAASMEMPARMPGMLAPEEMTQLEAARGAEFDRLFLQYMIRHHEGALTMVAELFGTPGAGQESELYRFASDVDADQRAEIRRMRTMQNASPGGAPG